MLLPLGGCGLPASGLLGSPKQHRSADLTISPEVELGDGFEENDATRPHGETGMWRRVHQPDVPMHPSNVLVAHADVGLINQPPTTCSGRTGR
jgi:hypothetical protein